MQLASCMLAHELAPIHTRAATACHNARHIRSLHNIALIGAQVAAAGADLQQASSDRLLAVCLALLEDAEPRVRQAVAECLSTLARQQGPAVWQGARAAVCASIESSWVGIFPSAGL